MTSDFWLLICSFCSRRITKLYMTTTMMMVNSKIALCDSRFYSAGCNWKDKKRLTEAFDIQLSREVAETATKSSPAPLQKHSPGDCTINMPPSNWHRRKDIVSPRDTLLNLSRGRTRSLAAADVEVSLEAQQAN